jgi:hypothetical protein
MERGRYNRERILELRQEHPEMTLEAIGQQVSLSKERVRQVLVKAEMTTLSTGRVSTKRKPIQPCTQCGSLEKTFITKHSMFCSPKCLYIAQQYNWKQWHNDNPDRNTTYTCTYCGKLKTIRTTLYKRQVKQHKNLFCSHACSLSAQWKDKNSALSISRQNNTKPDGLDLTS